jgi:chromosome segregation protein
MLKKIEERNVSLERFFAEKKKNEETVIDLKGKISEDKNKLSEFFTGRKKKTDSIHGSRNRIEDNNKKIKENENSLKKLREAIEVVIKKLIDAIEKRKHELENSEQERVEVKRVIENELSSIEMNLNSAIGELNNNALDSAKVFLEKINIKYLKETIDKFESYEDGFRSILFDKTGIHADKENLDKQIHEMVLEIDERKGDNVLLDEFIRSEQQELENINSMITRIERDVAKHENDCDWIEKHLSFLIHQIDDIIKQIDNLNEETAAADKVIDELNREIKESEDSLIQFNEESEALRLSIVGLVDKRSEIEKKIITRKSDSKKDEEEFTKVLEKINALEKNELELSFKRDSIRDYLWTEYEKKIADTDDLKINDAMVNDFQEEMQELRKRIQELGPINNLAIEEFRDLKKRFEYYIDQKTDIEKARQDIIDVIEDINKTSIDLFINTFNDIQKNFSDVFKRLFEGGEAFLEMIDPANVLDSGIDIMVRPPGKKFKNINLLSGGERALTAIALLFATYMVKPSPFCFLDEIDAPLDEQNIERFVKMLREFAKSTQFVIVTHNKKTMNICESIYGITMEEPGVSKLVSLKLERV